MRRLAAIGVLASSLLLLSGCSVQQGSGPEPSGTCRSNAGATPTAAERAADRVAMPEDRFWNLIAVLHGSNSDAAYARLSRALQPLPTRDLEAFEIRMTIALYRLDDECRAHWYEHNDPSGSGFIADDDFLYDRADTVSAGRRVWSEAVRTDTLPWGTTDAADGDGEELLYVADDAIDRRGGSSDAFEDTLAGAIDLDDETGWNPAGWPAPDPSSTVLNRL